MRVALLSVFAVYFVIWWLTLFVVLPIGMRTQAEDNEVLPGTVASAPTRFKAFRIFATTTVISALIYGAWYLAGNYFGLSFRDLPVFGPGLEGR